MFRVKNKKAKSNSNLLVPRVLVSRVVCFVSDETIFSRGRQANAVSDDCLKNFHKILGKHW